ncbi:hypothetical protein LCGC14_0821690 [marine sediment metagenome]|uniref:Uncharacterized protein n=1 Tax=marine sediment metagenome TaxID=412755 RepID=A0A0F9S3D5_9ZZZZ
MKNKIVSITEEMFSDAYHEDYEYLLGDYRLQEWSFGEREDVIEMSSVQRIDPKTKQVDFAMKSSKFRVLTMLYCIKEAPFGKVTQKAIRDLPVIVAEFLFESVSELNESMTEEQQKKFKES